MKKIKAPSDSYFTSRKLVMPDQINPNGTLFGGVLMSWIDKVAYMSAQRHSEVPHVVTVSLDQMQFKRPLKVGDHAVLTSSVDFVGRSSMEVGVRVEREVGYTSERTLAASALLTFVALDGEGRPVEVPRLVPATEDELDRFGRTRVRVKVRERLRAWFQERFPERQGMQLSLEIREKI